MHICLLLHTQGNMWSIYLSKGCITGIRFDIMRRIRAAILGW